jgi:hypothetical protein
MAKGGEDGGAGQTTARRVEQRGQQEHAHDAGTSRDSGSSTKAGATRAEIVRLSAVRDHVKNSSGMGRLRD